MKILVTGGLGFIGFNFIQFMEKNFKTDIYSVDNRINDYSSNRLNNQDSKKNIKIIDLDLTRDDLSVLPHDFDYIFHFAAYNGTKFFYEKPFDVNLHSTIPVLRLIDHYKDSKKLKRFFYAGSSESYASSVNLNIAQIPTPENVPLSVDDISEPRWSYANAKTSGEAACFAAHTQFNFPITIGRFHNIYGPYMGLHHVISDLYCKFLNEKYEIFGGDETRSFYYIEDAVRSIWSLTSSDESIGEIYNIGSETEVKIQDLAKKILEVLEINQSMLIQLPSLSKSVMRRCPDCSKINEIVNIEETTLDVGLRKTFESFANEKLINN